MFSFGLYCIFTVCFVLTLTSGQNEPDFLQSRVLYDYNPTNKLNAPANSPELRASISDIIASILNRRPTMQTTPRSPILSNTCSPCSCGSIKMNRRIVGGQDTPREQYPWMAMLLLRNKFYCGGALINDRYVLTAAHCVQGFSIPSISVRLLPYTRLATDGNTIERRVSRAIINRFDLYTFANDIALLKLNRPVEMSDILRPVCLPSVSESYVGDFGIVLGWGTVSENGRASDTLQQVAVPIISNAECRNEFPNVLNSMLCAGETLGGKDACQGDSGGPLHVIRSTKYIQAGIVSWGDGCGRANKPGVYTRVDNYINWIRSNTGDACYCN